MQRTEPVAEAGQSLRIDGHFGEFLQGRLGPSGPVVLVTLPSRVHGVAATRVPGGPLRVTGGLVRAERARALLGHLGAGLDGQVHLLAEGGEPGCGTGTSTAALLALAHLAGQGGRAPEDLAAACLAAEGASDPLMLPEPGRVLWASRAGRVLAPLPPVPEMAVLGGLWGPARPTRAGDERYPDIADLVAAWQAAPGAAALARLAAESAARTLRLRGPAEDPTPALAARLGAAGWMMSHSGAARGLIFAPGAVPGGAAAALTRAGFRKLVVLGPGGWPLPRPQE